MDSIRHCHIMNLSEHLKLSSKLFSFLQYTDKDEFKQKVSNLLSEHLKNMTVMNRLLLLLNTINIDRNLKNQAIIDNSKFLFFILINNCHITNEECELFSQLIDLFEQLVQIDCINGNGTGLKGHPIKNCPGCKVEAGKLCLYATLSLSSDNLSYFMNHTCLLRRIITTRSLIDPYQYEIFYSAPLKKAYLLRHTIGWSVDNLLKEELTDEIIELILEIKTNSFQDKNVNEEQGNEKQDNEEQTKNSELNLLPSTAIQNNETSNGKAQNSSKNINEEVRERTSNQELRTKAHNGDQKNYHKKEEKNNTKEHNLTTDSNEVSKEGLSNDKIQAITHGSKKKKTHQGQETGDKKEQLTEADPNKLIGEVRDVQRFKTMNCYSDLKEINQKNSQGSSLSHSSIVKDNSVYKLPQRPIVNEKLNFYRSKIYKQLIEYPIRLNNLLIEYLRVRIPSKGIAIALEILNLTSITNSKSSDSILSAEQMAHLDKIYNFLNDLILSAPEQALIHLEHCVFFCPHNECSGCEESSKRIQNSASCLQKTISTQESDFQGEQSFMGFVEKCAQTCNPERCYMCRLKENISSGRINLLNTYDLFCVALSLRFSSILRTGLTLQELLIQKITVVRDFILSNKNKTPIQDHSVVIKKLRNFICGNLKYGKENNLYIKQIIREIAVEMCTKDCVDDPDHSNLSFYNSNGYWKNTAFDDPCQITFYNPDPGEDFNRNESDKIEFLITPKEDQEVSAEHDFYNPGKCPDLDPYNIHKNGSPATTCKWTITRIFSCDSIFNQMMLLIGNGNISEVFNLIDIVKNVQYYKTRILLFTKNKRRAKLNRLLLRIYGLTEDFDLYDKMLNESSHQGEAKLLREYFKVEQKLDQSTDIAG